MAVSQNGYSANDRSVITRYSVSDSGLYMNLRKGSPGELIAHMVRWFDRNIRDIDPGILDDWSYAERPIRGGTELSNHASGTAADVDATKWPLGVEPSAYLTADEIARVRAQLKVYEGCIRWGGDYTGRKDPMHFEINRDLSTCDRVWAKIQNDPEDEIMAAADDIKAMLQDITNRIGGLQYATFPDSGPGGSAGEVLKRVRSIDATVAALAARDPKVTIDAEAIAAAIPDELAEQVVSKLAEKLAARPTA